MPEQSDYLSFKVSQYTNESIVGGLVIILFLNVTVAWRMADSFIKSFYSFLS